MNFRRRRPRMHITPGWGYRCPDPEPEHEERLPTRFGPARPGRRKARGRFLIERQWKSWRKGTWGNWTVRGRYKAAADRDRNMVRLKRGWAGRAVRCVRYRSRDLPE